MKRFALLLLVISIVITSHGQTPLSSVRTQIAVISDPHVQDVTGHPELLRSLDEQVQSTRLFNENIFAFRAALDDAARREIKLVIISGDLTDDGQDVAQKAMKNILDEYAEKHGMRFFVTPGNHDPASPFGKPLTAKGLLRADGSRYTMVGDSSLYKPGYTVSPLANGLGHKEMVECYSNFGYFPQPEYKYWATPYSTYSYEGYNYSTAKQEIGLEQRMFTYAGNIKAYESSYVVEPIDGLWLLSIDSGVYLPDNNGNYKNSGVAGYNNTIEHKQYLVSWIKRVCDDAKRLGKKVIAFSHFPLLDFNCGASEALERSWGRSKFDIERLPTEKVGRAMFDAGIRLHFAGHMHIYQSEKMTVGNETMYNIQTPSVATCVPAYRLITLEEDGLPELESVIMNNVPGFDTFFDRYRKEWEYTKSQGNEPIWYTEVLDAKNYGEFCDWQFRDLVRNRFAVRDLPEILRNEMLPKTGQQLLDDICSRSKNGKAYARDTKSMEQWTGMDLLTDFYRLHYSGKLALHLIPEQRLNDYMVLFDAIEHSDSNTEFDRQMKDFAYAFKCFLNAKDYTDIESREEIMKIIIA